MERNKVVTSNLIWRLLERFGAQGVTFIVSIVLARVLEPSVYGTVALITIITTILQVFVDSGLGTALIQKKDADSLDFSTVFYFNFLVCIVLYIGLFAFAPYIANFYNNMDLVPVIRVLGLILVISGFKNIQNAYVSKYLLFKLYFFATLGGTITAGIVGIWMVYHGYGIWALVVQNIVNQGFDTIILWVLVKWRPTKEFSISRLRNLFSYAWKLLLSSLLDTVWGQLRQLIIGKIYSTNDLAYYNKGNEFPNYTTLALNSSIDSVLLPVMSQAQDSIDEVRSMTRRAIKTSSFILWPMMMGLAGCSSSFICLVLTDKWLPCVPYLIIFCIVYAFYPIHTANLNAIKALGRSDLFLILEIIKKILNLLVILLTVQFGPFYMALGSIFVSVCSQIINSWPNRKLLNYKYQEQIMDIFPYIVMSVLMAGIVYSIELLNLPNLVTIGIQIPVGIIFYIGVSWILKIDSFVYCINILKKYVRRKQ
mgnify:CR=1 FL=1|jgi:O-antigen/teichoic acid export membrane protein